MNESIKLSAPGQMSIVRPSISGATNTYNVEQSGPGTNVAYVNHMDAHVSLSVLTGTQLSPDGSVVSVDSPISREFYSLFVLTGDFVFESASGSFLVDRSRVFTYTETDIRNRFLSLTDADREIIKTFPALFMSENHDYGRTDPDHKAYFGRVTDIKPHGTDIKIKYWLQKDFPQQLLNDFSPNFCIPKNKGYSELNNTHWSLKRVDLVDELQEIGVALI